MCADCAGNCAEDATWYLGNTPDDAYVQQEADYFTKYTFSDTWRDNDVHGQWVTLSKLLTSIYV